MVVLLSSSTKYNESVSLTSYCYATLSLIQTFVA
nr:MAG TPA: hypothetical protein [Caudoviricetes sp.]